MKPGNTKDPLRKHYLKRPVFRIAGLIVFAGMVCGAILLPRSTAFQQYRASQKINAVINDYTDNVVLKTLESVVDGIRKFEDAVGRLEAKPSDDQMAEVAHAWREARARWQAISTFSYGPCAFYDFDKQVASWPIDRSMIDYTIAQAGQGGEPIDARTLREKKYSTLRGFFAAEYILFHEGKPRSAGAVTPDERKYLRAVAQAMLEESLDFQASWVGSDKMEKNDAARLAAAGFKPRKSFAAEFRRPGLPESRYYSQSIVLQEMFQEAHTVIEDTCPLIEDWLGSGDPKQSESRHSLNAVSDILNLIQGVENAYQGGLAGHRGKAMAELVADKDKVIDRRIRIAIAEARYRIADIGDPYAPATGDRDLKVRRATDACWKLATKFGASVGPVCLDPVSRPWAAYVQ